MPYKHGYYKEPWYVSYRSMMDRRYRKKAGNYWDYGAKGVKVCEEWHNVESFKNWVEHSGFKPGLTLDRIDVKNGYSPENCRWATRKEQANNRSNTVYLEFNGERHTISEWAEIRGINRSTLNNRVCAGMPVKKALSRRNLSVSPY